MARFVVTLTDAEGSRSWTCGDWETAYADARAESGLGAECVTVNDTSGVCHYWWSARADGRGDRVRVDSVLEPARVHSVAHRYSSRVEVQA